MLMFYGKILIIYIIFIEKFYLYTNTGILKYSIENFDMYLYCILYN